MVLHAPASPTTEIANGPNPVPNAPLALPHYHALDSVRAVAMLLGVVYHSLLFRMMVGGPPPGSIGMSSAANWFEQWLHGFRMPVFFLISGFFADDARKVFHPRIPEATSRENRSPTLRRFVHLRPRISFDPEPCVALVRRWPDGTAARLRGRFAPRLIRRIRAASRRAHRDERIQPAVRRQTARCRAAQRHSIRPDGATVFPAAE